MKNYMIHVKMTYENDYMIKASSKAAALRKAERDYNDGNCTPVYTDSSDISHTFEVMDEEEVDIEKDED